MSLSNLDPVLLRTYYFIARKLQTITFLKTNTLTVITHLNQAS